MKVIIAGSRTIEDYNELKIAIKSAPFEISEVVSGTANEVDKLGELWAKENDIPIKRFKAAWEKFGKAAGYFRNVEMGTYADALILVWDGYSKGSSNMKSIAMLMQMPYYEHIVGYNGF